MGTSTCVRKSDVRDSPVHCLRMSSAVVDTDGDGDDSQPTATLQDKVVNFFWLVCGFRTPPDVPVIKILAIYALSASCHVIVDRYLGRYTRVDSVDVILFQLLAAAGAVVLFKLIGFDKEAWQPEHGFNEIVAWGLLAAGFAVQLIASIRTLSTHNITEWYFLLHYLTPCVVPFFEPRDDGDSSLQSKFQLDLLVFPSITLVAAGAVMYATTGAVGPGTWTGFWWSMVWIITRIGLLIGTRMVIVEFKTPVSNRLLYQTGIAFAILTLLEEFKSDWMASIPAPTHNNTSILKDEDVLVPYQTWMLVIAACLSGPTVSFARLSLLGSTSATSTSVFTSVALLPMRVWYFGSRLIYY